MKQFLYWGSALILAVAIGLGSAFWAVKRGAPGTIAAGPWETGMSFGSADADMYTRARVAVFGLLALDKRETMYYTAIRDSAGGRLSGDCTYAVEGRDLAALWWSITAYGPDSFLIPNEANIYSYAMTTVKREPDGRFVIRVSADRQEGNWLPVKAGERFDLTARFYNPDVSVYDAPANADLPRIVKESCK